MTPVKTLLTMYHLLNVLQQQQQQQQQQKIENQKISHIHHSKDDLFSILYKKWQTRCWKPRLCKYKSHIKKNVKSSSIVKHFIDSYIDTVNPSKYLRLILIYCVTNTENNSKEEIDD